MKAYIPAIIFLLVAGLGIAGVLIWQQRFSGRAKAIERQIKVAEALRVSGEARQLVQDISEQSALLSWLDDRLSKFSALKLLLIRANSDKTPGEFVVISLGLMVLGIIIALAVRLGPLGVINTGIICAVFPWWYMSGKANKRRLKFEDQFPEALDFISRSLRAGHGLAASLGMAGDELPDPVGTELRMTFDEINFGIPFQEAMANLMARINSPDLTFFTVAVVIQRETGGNLTELLANLAKLIRDRVKLKGKVRVLASEGRFSGVLLGALPFVLSILLTSVNPEYMGMLWKTPEGHNLIVTGLFMMIVGAFFMHRIVQIKV